MKEYSPTRRSVVSCLVLVGIVTGYYILDNLSLFSLIESGLLIILIKTVYWGGLIYIALRYPKIKPKSKLRMRSNIIFMAMVHGVIYVVIWFCAGIIDGFGKSPYNNSPIGIMTNIATVGLILVGKELVRSHLINNLSKKENYLLFILISLYFTFISFNTNSLLGLTDFKKAIQYISEYVAPCFSRNLLATYLSSISGPLASIGYLGIYNIFLYLCPILPGLKWITAALVGVMCPIFSLTTIQNSYMKNAGLLKKVGKKEEGIVGWIITCIISIAIIWFAVGVFPIYPSVIATGSMKPEINPGDLIIVHRTEDTNFQLGEVIQFQRNGVSISHRIIEIINNENKVQYRTKGDNNSTEDLQLVNPEEIKGKVIYVIPKIGWPTLILKGQANEDIEGIEF